ncbi:hypothetical protein EVAR_98706_1 [Eumeta japonica]|uniref:Uncharacterized protein n=1 Tax=Eumeta variegata TaxID=151549 RepID=A0A4C1XUT4_EUMVA|nr:hypothetical protein EVAR_98706_1 [Eumeta japonica]
MRLRGCSLDDPVAAVRAVAPRTAAASAPCRDIAAWRAAAPHRARIVAPRAAASAPPACHAARSARHRRLTRVRLCIQAAICYRSSGDPRSRVCGREVRYRRFESAVLSTATPVASRTNTPASSANSSRAHSPARKSKGKRAASSSSEEDTAGSDSTVVGSDDESGSATNTWDSGSPGGSSRSRANSDASFSLVKGKNKRQSGKRQRNRS